MPNILDILGYLKINDEESELEYLTNMASSDESGSKTYFEEDELDDTDVMVDVEVSNDTGTNKPSPVSSQKTDYGDLSGREFGKLKVLYEDKERSGKTNSRKYYVCECKCGNIKSIRADHLYSGNTSSCGCTKKNDLSGRIFGKLKVLYKDEEKSRHTQRTHWVCECKCGVIKTIPAKCLLNGNSKSCGCNISSNAYDLTSKDYGIGYTKNGTIFLFDKEDYEKISQYMWTNTAGGYIIAYYNDADGNKKHIMLHRLVMGVTDSDVYVDHIHHNLADNRKSELRVVSRGENNCNKQLSKANTSGNTGVTFDKRSQKWRAYIAINHERMWLGYFSTKEEAIKAREEAEKRYFGEYRYQGTSTTDQILDNSDSDSLIYTKSKSV